MEMNDEHTSPPSGLRELLTVLVLTVGHRTPQLVEEGMRSTAKKVERRRCLLGRHAFARHEEVVGEAVERR